MSEPTATVETAGDCERCGTAIPRTHGSSKCSSCGEPLSVEINRRLSNPESRRLLAERGILPYDDDDEAKEAPVEPAGLDIRTAGFPIRATARGIDTAVGILISLPATVLAFLVLAVIGRPGGPSEWAQEMQGMTAGVIAWSLGGSTLYAAIAEWIGGATIGKLACGLRVVSADFTPLTWRAALVRSAAFFVDGLLFGLVGLHAMQQGYLQQRYGDRWARTIVVRVRLVPQSNRGAARAVLGTIIGCGVWGVFLTCANLSHVFSR